MRPSIRCWAARRSARACRAWSAASDVASVSPRPFAASSPSLERGEAIADIRQISLSLGLLSPRLLSFEAYRRHGGRYTHEQTATLGGFDTLRRVA